MTTLNTVSLTRRRHLVEGLLQELGVLELDFQRPPHLGVPLRRCGERGGEHPREELQRHGQQELHEGDDDEHGEGH